ncbi:unnamed protein product [Urochloa decumbens]|uniref:Uncharacterized protein n=1 Tax=Urochloa decumbens TaxID=240449 RepID=A0ABC9EWP3_9POAL
MAFAGVLPGVLSSAAGTGGLSAALRLVASPRARALPAKMHFPNPKLRDLAAPRASSARQAAASRGARVITSAAAPFADLRARICSPAAAIHAGFGVVPHYSFVVLKPPTPSMRTPTLMVAYCTGEETGACLGDPEPSPSFFQKLSIFWTNALLWGAKHIPGTILLGLCVWIGLLNLKGENTALDVVSVCEKAYKVYKLLSKALPIIVDFIRIFIR